MTGNRIRYRPSPLLSTFTVVFSVVTFYEQHKLLQSADPLPNTAQFSKPKQLVHPSPNVAPVSKFEEATNDPTQGRRCVGLGDGEGMDRMLGKYGLVYVLFPAKAAGSSMKEFTNQCLGMSIEDNILGHGDDSSRALLVDLLKNASRAVPIVSSHLYESQGFVDVVRQSTTRSLIIYLHREETERLKSAVGHVLATRNYKPEWTEDETLQVIERLTGEIGHGAPRLLNCDAYGAIKDNAPNLAFLHYERADRLQRLLARRHCPGQVARRMNAASEKPEVAVRLADNSTVRLADWLAAKADLLPHALHLNSAASCQAETRRMQRELWSCRGGALHYSSADFFAPPNEFV